MVNRSRYVINHGALLRSEFDSYRDFHIGDMLSIVAFLSEQISRPHFDLQHICSHCEWWDRGQRNNLDTLDDKPIRVGAEDSTQGCHGCWYSLLDPVDEAREESDRGHVEQLIALQEAAIAHLEDCNVDEIHDAQRTKRQRHGKRSKSDTWQIQGGLHRRIAEAKARLIELQVILERYHDRRCGGPRRMLTMDLSAKIAR